MARCRADSERCLGFPGLWPGDRVRSGEVSHDHRTTSESGDLLDRDASAEGGPLKSATIPAYESSTATPAMERAFQCARVAEDNKGKDILVLDMRGITPLYDFMILVTGSSRR